MKKSTALVAIKIVHTVVWAFFVACILAIPIAANSGRFRTAFLLIAAVLFEVVVLLINRWSCPLTEVAARYTDNRQANFDIYLPLWLAKYNKLVFGALFACGVAYTAYGWWKHGVAA
jgi:hypothetical protein